MNQQLTDFGTMSASARLRSPAHHKLWFYPCHWYIHRSNTPPSLFHTGYRKRNQFENVVVCFIKRSCIGFSTARSNRRRRFGAAHSPDLPPALQKATKIADVKMLPYTYAGNCTLRFASRSAWSHAPSAVALHVAGERFASPFY